MTTTAIGDLQRDNVCSCPLGTLEAQLGFVLFFQHKTTVMDSTNRSIRNQTRSKIKDTSYNHCSLQVVTGSVVKPLVC